MFDKLTGFTDYFRKIPAAFLVAFLCVIGLILFIPEEVAKTLAVDNFRNEYRVFLGPVFLLLVSFAIARIFIYFRRSAEEKKRRENRREFIHNLTAEEKGYLFQYLGRGRNTVHVGIEDGIMGGLEAKGITYRASDVGDLLTGFPFNLQPWAREYLEQNPHLLDGHTGRPLTPGERLNAGW